MIFLVLLCLDTALGTKSIATVYPVSPFHPRVDAADLRKAMKGLGTDEEAIIRILGNRSRQQRQKIQQVYDQERNLIKDLKGDLSGKFEDIVLALMCPPAEYLAKELHRAIGKMRTNKKIIIEIFCSNDSASLKEIKDAYKRLYNKEFYREIWSDSPEDVDKLLISLCSCEREGGLAKVDIAPSLADKLLRAGQKVQDGETDDHDAIRKILTTCSYATLLLVFDIFKKETGTSFGDFVKREEIDDDFGKAVLAIYKVIAEPVTFFAEALYDSMVGLGTRNHDLIRLVVTRCELDMENVVSEYSKLYDTTLEHDIKGDTSGDFEKMLLALITG